ncbi:MAG: FAD-binding protein [Polyangiaceae bacterium]|nr:FAD-binding protein [Polyangiaceae bacterium]
MLTLRSPLLPVSLTRADRARLLLSRALGPSRIITEADRCEPFSRDESEAQGQTPAAVVLAESAEDILATFRVASETEVPVVPRSGGSGKTGGAVPLNGGIVLVTRGMDSIKDIDRNDLLAVVEPGVILGDLHAAVEREGLFYPPDPNSAAYCCLGGNVAENAGGPRAFKYGVTREYVLGLETCLISGERLQVGRRTVKGVTGYDLTALLVGSEGTLGVFSELTLKLIPLPERVITLMATFSTARRAAEAVQSMIAARVIPRCIEFLDAVTTEAVRTRGVMVEEGAGALLLLEVDGDESACEASAQRVGNACDDAGALAVRVAQSTAQRDRLWEARREMSPAIRKMARHKLSEDVVVPRSKLSTLLDDVERIGQAQQVRMLSYGHAGDGNLHVNFLWDEDDEIPRVEKAVGELFRSVVSLGGTLSGEHGIGVLKAPYLHLEQSDALIAAQRRIKAALDPQGLLNPGKIFWPSTHRAC